MRHRKPIKTTQKIVTATATGEVINYDNKKSTNTRINELLNALGIDKDVFNFQVKNRMFNKMYNHKYLGYQG